MSDRRKWGIREIVMLVTLTLTTLVNVIALTWGAATMNASVNTLNGTVARLESAMTKLVSDLADVKIDYNARISVLEHDNGRKVQ